jgi:hypothetical protein
VSEVKNHIALNKNNKKIIPEILGTQEVEIRRIAVQGQSGKNS